jgi:hypothetical protein
MEKITITVPNLPFGEAIKSKIILQLQEYAEVLLQQYAKGDTISEEDLKLIDEGIKSADSEPLVSNFNPKL